MGQLIYSTLEEMELSLRNPLTAATDLRNATLSLSFSRARAAAASKMDDRDRQSDTEAKRADERERLATNSLKRRFLLCRSPSFVLRPHQISNAEAFL